VRRYALMCLMCASGCALTPQQAAQMNNVDLCWIYISQNAVPESRRTAEHVLEQRDVDCRQYLEILTYRQQALDAQNLMMLQTGLQLLSNSGPR
jgi:hypothetical protein